MQKRQAPSETHHQKFLEWMWENFRVDLKLTSLIKHSQNPFRGTSNQGDPNFFLVPNVVPESATSCKILLHDHKSLPKLILSVRLRHFLGQNVVSDRKLPGNRETGKLWGQGKLSPEFCSAGLQAVKNMPANFHQDFCYHPCFTRIPWSVCTT